MVGEDKTGGWTWRGDGELVGSNPGSREYEGKTHQV